MPAPPDLPQPDHLDRDSMLSRAFGREVANYFSSSPLNRLSFLREDHTFMRQAFDHSTSQFVLFKNLSPLVESSSSNIVYANHDDIKPIVPNNPYEKTEEERVKDFNSSSLSPQLVFLGVNEKRLDGLRYKNHAGSPYFALDITPQAPYENEANGIIAKMEQRGLKFLEGMRAMDFSADTAAIYAMGRALLDWNARSPYCATCGQRTMSIGAGTKRICPPTDCASPGGTVDSTNPTARSLATERPPCSTRTSRSNLAFPRTDPTIIVAVVSHDGKRLLLGRQRRWPPHRFSTLAGFIEPAESVEDAVRREVWEESGVVLSRVVVHSTQPWPYPANLMIGAIAQVAGEADEEIKLENDPELETAKWFDFDEVREALRISTFDLSDAASGASEGYEQGNLRLPPPTAIANRLITAVVEGDFLASMPLSKI